MYVNAPTLRVDINQLERVQCFAAHLIRLVPYEERLRQLNLFSLERRHLRVDLFLALVKLTFTRLASHSAQPEPDYEDTPTDYYKGQTVFNPGSVPQFGL